MKKIQMEVIATDSEFFTQFFRVLTFSSNKIGFYLLWTLLNRVLIPRKTAWILSLISHKEGKVQIGNL